MCCADTTQHNLMSNESHYSSRMRKKLDLNAMLLFHDILIYWDYKNSAGGALQDGIIGPKRAF